MKFILSAILLVFAMNLSAQKINKKVTDPFRQVEIMLNNCTRDALVAFPDFKQSYDPNYATYAPDSLAVKALNSLSKDAKITIVMGTWCGDSKLQVPHFYKVLDMAGINSDDVALICVDGVKHAENGLIDKLKITNVPTFIFTDKEGKELGRITERPQKSIEADMKAILSKSK